MGGHSIARVGSLAACLWLFGAWAASSQIGQSHTPPFRPRPLHLHAELVEWRGPLGDPTSGASALAQRGPLPEGFRVVSQVTGHAIRDYPHRIERGEERDLLLTVLGRERRRVRVLLEVEGATPPETRILKLRLDRRYGAARGRLIETLGPRGPWLRVELRRP